MNGQNEFEGVISVDLRLRAKQIAGLIGLVPNVEDRVWVRHLLRELHSDIDRVAAFEKAALLPNGEEALALAAQQ